ncbi:hypothetical protein V6N11_009223 [Hibiscus sabdariffa]|uniref:Uncharacterized protein n=1 Tax=Hibiscus sabdariffa TaxID=183260 RepID=A0ABR2PQL4_9ROSI
MFCLETSSWSSSFKTRIVKKSLPGLFGVNGTRHGTYSALRQSKVAGCEDWNAPPRDFVKFNIDCVNCISDGDEVLNDGYSVPICTFSLNCVGGTYIEFELSQVIC